MEEWVAIWEMARQGLSVSEIGRWTGRDRETIRKVLKEEAPQVHRRMDRPWVSKLDPFHDYFIRRLEVGCTNAVALVQEIVGVGRCRIALDHVGHYSY